jgi:hydrogenase/urease accessory protein HupE
MHADSITEEKRFATLAAQYALAGHALIRSKEGDGQAPYYCTRWGFIRPVQGLDHAEQLLEQMTGKQ